jgi:zinc protease
MLARSLAALLLLAPFQAPLPAQEPTVVRPWEHESSDLPVDPRFRFGHLENGLRWAWARNGEPRHRSYLRLHVDVGSLAEEDAERGMAHFLEHMAFNGSEHFAADTLVEWFQRHGMAFGADLNAHTDFGETVYDIDLPDSDEKLLDEALLVLRDFAFGLTLASAEIDKEKGVIDGEETERDSAGYRLFVRQIQEFLGETRLDDRIPIGTKAARDRFSAESVRAFYAKWYRPEHMTLIVVGDLGELDPVPLIAKHFGSVPRPAAPLVKEPGPGKVTRFAQRKCFHEPEIPSVSLRIEKLWPWVDKPFTAERWREESPLSVARDMLDLRFAELSKDEAAPFLSASTGRAAAFDVVDGEELTISCAPEKWRAALALGEQELRRALEHGFQPAELEELRKNALRGLREAVEREGTEPSSSLVESLLGAAESRYVPTSAATRRALLEPVYQALTPEACQAALVEAWSKGELALTALGKLDLGADAAKELDAAWAASRAVPVAKGAEIAVAEFGYPSTPAPELLAAATRGKIEDFDIHTLRFPNGVALDVKRTDFKEKQILFRVLVGEGRLALAMDQLALGWMAERVFEEGGLGRHSYDELRRVLAGKQVGLAFQVGTESFGFGGATTAEDLRLQCELVCAFLTDAGWREDGFVRVKREVPLLYEGLLHQHQGPVVTSFMAELFAGDERFTFFPRSKLEGVELPAVRKWLSAELTDAPIELAFVGDLEPAAVEEAVAATFGKLPPRRALRALDERRKAPAPRSGVHQEHTIETQVPKSLVMLAFPVPDARDVERARRFEMLAEVLRDRLRVEVRERLGAAYSPTAGLQQSRTLPGVGLMLVQAMTEPDAAETLKDACLAVTDALAKDGVTTEELERLRAPVLEGLRDSRRQNGWWLGILSETQRRPAVLDEARGQIASYESAKAEELTALAREFLPRARVSSVVVDPAAPAEPPK